MSTSAMDVSSVDVSTMNELGFRLHFLWSDILIFLLAASLIGFAITLYPVSYTHLRAHET